jgi:hypothetical protein
MTFGVLAELERLEKAATPGPWLCDDRLARDGDTKVRQSNGCGVAYCCDETASQEGIEQAKRDAALIAAARNALGDLLKIARAVTASDPVSWLPGGGIWGCCICYGRGKEAKDAHENGCAYVLCRCLPACRRRTMTFADVTEVQHGT